MLYASNCLFLQNIKNLFCLCTTPKGSALCKHLNLLADQQLLVPVFVPLTSCQAKRQNAGSRSCCYCACIISGACILHAGTTIHFLFGLLMVTCCTVQASRLASVNVQPAEAKALPMQVHQQWVSIQPSCLLTYVMLCMSCPACHVMYINVLSQYTLHIPDA